MSARANVSDVPEGMKVCCVCRRVLDVCEFHRNRREKDGFARRCKVCQRVQREKMIVGRRVSGRERAVGYDDVRWACDRWLGGNRVV